MSFTSLEEIFRFPVEPARKRRRRSKQPRDAQRSKVYAWERKSVFDKPDVDNVIELKDIAVFCRLALDAAGLKYRTPRILDGRGRRKACYDVEARALKLPRWARRTPVILHELAHYIVDKKYGCDTVPWHGRFFMQEYFALLALHGWDRWDLRRSAHEARIKF